MHFDHCHLPPTSQNLRAQHSANSYCGYDHLKLGQERRGVNAVETGDEQRTLDFEQRREPHGGKAALRLPPLIFVFGHVS
jgi:hypothetical protein